MENNAKKYLVVTLITLAAFGGIALSIAGIMLLTGNGIPNFKAGQATGDTNPTQARLTGSRQAGSNGFDFNMFESGTTQQEQQPRGVRSAGAGPRRRDRR